MLATTHPTDENSSLVITRCLWDMVPKPPQKQTARMKQSPAMDKLGSLGEGGEVGLQRQGSYEMIPQ